MDDMTPRSAMVCGLIERGTRSTPRPVGERAGAKIYIGTPAARRHPLLSHLCALFAALAPCLGLATGAKAEPIRVVMIGTSLTSGYGLPPGHGVAARLGEALRLIDPVIQIIDAGVSGDTSAGGLARLDWALGSDTNAVIVELGANDALRGLSPAQTEANLAAILDKLEEKKLPAMIIGMKAPRNLGPDYVKAFDAIYPRLAEKHPYMIYYPFLLEGVAGDPTLNQPDGIHPNEQGVGRIVNSLLPHARSLVERVRRL